MKAMKAGKEAGYAPTIGQHFDMLRQTSEHTLEDSLYTVSMGEYEPNLPYERKYPHWKLLFRFCRDWIDEHRDGDYVECKTEADVMEAGMKRLAKETGNGRPLKAPGAWLAVIKRLRELHRTTTCVNQVSIRVAQ